MRPYFASALYALVPVPVPGLGTLGVDRYWRCYFDPDCLKRWKREPSATTMLHEVGHLLRGHPERMAKFAEHDRANVAADLEINDDLLAEGLKFPFEVCTPQNHKLPVGLLAEQYYDLLPKSQANRARLGSGADRAGGGASSKGPLSDPYTGPRPQGRQSAPTADDSDSAPQDASFPVASPARDVAGWPGNGNCGSAAHGQVMDYELGEPSDDAPGLSEVDAEVVRGQVAKAIGQQPGSVPAGWQQWAQDRLNPKVDWRRQFPALVRRAVADARGSVDFSYKRPSRRLPGPVVFPSMTRPLLTAAVVADTSGSMDGSLDEVLTEIGGILKAGCATVTVLATDAAVHSCKRVMRTSQVELIGGGGTDMGVGLEAAAALRPRPDVIVVLTDGYTGWPEHAPRGIRTVVGLIGGGPEGPEWAKQVRIAA